jgi:ATP-dependent protease ClpP protease subunit
MAEKTDSIENVLSNGIDIKNRRIYFGALLESYDESGSEFTWRSCEWAIRAIHIMENEAPNKPIELHMSSPGGDPYAMLRLIDVIQSTTCQIKFFGGERSRLLQPGLWLYATSVIYIPTLC